MAWVIADGLTTTFTCCVDTIYISAFVDIEANNPPKVRARVRVRLGVGVRVRVRVIGLGLGLGLGLVCVEG